MDIDVLIVIALILGKPKEKEKIRKTKTKRLWMKKWFKERPTFTHQNLLNELNFSAPKDFQNFLRFNISEYNELLQLIRVLIEKKDTFMRAAISVKQRLSITLCYLATGNGFEDLKFTSAISPQAIGKIIIETCNAIITVLKDYMKVPETEDEWKTIVDDFYAKWSFPNCVGAVDGKHVAIRKPKNSGSLFYNYKKIFSVVLMAVVNANYEFIVADVGINGRISDGGVLRNTLFGKALYSNRLNLPQLTALPKSDRILPLTFIGDDAFQLTDNFMKPFAHTGLTKEQRIFNYRLSRARRIVENAFGILATRFGIFQRAINLEPDKVQIVVLACCFLHSFIRKKKSSQYCSRGFVDMENMQTEVESTWRPDFQLQELQRTISRNSTNSSKYIREQFCGYFNNEGQVSWQNNMV